MTRRYELQRDGVTLSVLDFGGTGPPALLLHGLAGHAGEWTQTAEWLTRDHHALALDARGHGYSTRRPADVSPDAQVADAALVLTRLGEGPGLVIGQSLGGVTAMLLAAQHPELVAGLILADAAPGDGGRGDRAARAMSDALGTWPVPFTDRRAAVGYFGAQFGDGAAGPWADGLQKRGDGLWPRFDAHVMARTLGEMEQSSTWPQWRAITCPTMVVRAEHGVLDADVVDQLQAERHDATVVELAGARHDLHLDQPRAWRKTVQSFVATSQHSRSL